MLGVRLTAVLLCCCVSQGVKAPCCRAVLSIISWRHGVAERFWRSQLFYTLLVRCDPS